MSTESDDLASPSGDDARSASTETEIITPVVIDLGKVKRKHIKRLKRGTGKLADEVLDVIDEVVDELGDELDGATLVPIVMVYKKKRKKSKVRTIRMPF